MRKLFHVQVRYLDVDQLKKPNGTNTYRQLRIYLPAVSNITESETEELIGSIPADQPITNDIR